MINVCLHCTDIITDTRTQKNNNNSNKKHEQSEAFVVGCSCNSCSENFGLFPINHQWWIRLEQKLKLNIQL